MRKRRASLAKRTALALLLAGPALVHADLALAAEEVPVLRVADQTPDLAAVESNGSDTGEASRRPSSRRAPGGNPTARLTSANGGWIARNAIGRKGPLTDPASIPSQSNSDRTTPEGGAVSQPESVDAQPALVDEIERDDKPSEDQATHPAPVALKNLESVPLMQRQQQASTHRAAEPAEAVEPAEADEPAENLERSRAKVEATRPENVAKQGGIQGRGQAALPVRRPAIEPEDAPELGTPQPVQPAPRAAPVMSASVARLQRPIEQCLRYYYQRPEIASGRSSWGLMHSIMVYGVDTQVIGGRKRYNAIAWLAGNNVCRGKRLLAVDRYGIAPRQGVGLQGHQGQLLAVFSLVGVPLDYPLHVDRQKFTVEDLVAHEQRECRSGEELTFTLIGLAHYIDTDSEWRSKDGERWDFERLLQEELAQPVVGAACGGTHRLMGLSHALRIRKEEGRPITGQWARAETFIEDFTKYAWKLQNRDGSMSTEWFERRGDNGDLDRKIQTTGHIVEWMLCHTPDDQLQDDRLVRAVRFLTSAMSRNPAREKEIGPKGHALRSLAVYHQRLFDAPSAWEADSASSRAQATVRRGARSHR